MKKIIIIFVSFIAFSSCLSYEYSNKSKNDSFKAEVTSNPEVLVLNNNEIEKQYTNDELAYARGISAFQVLSIAADGVKMLIEMDKKKYTQEYATSLGELYFYENISTKGSIDPESMQFEGIRTYRLLNNKQTKEIDTAFYMVLKICKENPNEIINNSIFRLEVDSLYIGYSKAKIPGYYWFLPWTVIYKKKQLLNIDIEIAFYSSWIEKNGTIHTNEEIGKFLLNLRNIPLSNKDNQRNNYFANLKGRKLTGYSYLVPRSYGYFKNKDNQILECYGHGSYSFKVSVKESGKEKFVEKIIFDNSTSIIDAIVKQAK